MSKHMDQNTFDVGAIGLVFLSGIPESINENTFNGVYGEIWHKYESMYPDDVTMKHQTIEAACHILKLIRGPNYDRNLSLSALQLAFELRSKLDANLNERGALSRAFGGAWFTPGHPSPETRVIKCVENFKKIYGSSTVAILKDLGMLGKH